MSRSIPKTLGIWSPGLKRKRNIPASICHVSSFPGGSDSKESAMQEIWVRSLGQEDPCRREWQLTPVFLPEEFPWTEEPDGCSPWGCRVGHNWVTHTHTHTHTHTDTAVCGSNSWWVLWAVAFGRFVMEMRSLLWVAQVTEKPQWSPSWIFYCTDDKKCFS